MEWGCLILIEVFMTSQDLQLTNTKINKKARARRKRPCLPGLKARRERAGMHGGEKTHRKKLKRILHEATLATTDSAAHAKAYNEYLRELYWCFGEANVFQYLIMEPMQNATNTMFDYILASVSISAPVFYERLINESMKLYVANLLDYNLTTQEAIDENNLEKLYSNLVYDSLKALDSLGKKSRRLYCGLDDLTIEEQEELEEQDRVAYIAWFNILQRINHRLSLPSAKKVVKCFLHEIEPIGQEVLEINDFTEFNATLAERQYYEGLCEGKIVNFSARIKVLKQKKKNLGAKIRGVNPPRVRR